MCYIVCCSITVQTYHLPSNMILEHRTYCFDYVLIICILYTIFYCYFKLLYRNPIYLFCHIICIILYIMFYTCAILCVVLLLYTNLFDFYLFAFSAQKFIVVKLLYRNPIYPIFTFLLTRYISLIYLSYPVRHNYYFEVVIVRSYMACQFFILFLHITP